MLPRCAILFPLPLLWRKLLTELTQDSIHQTLKRFQNPPKVHNNQLKQPTTGAKEHQSLPQTWPVWGEGDKGFPYCQPWPVSRAHLLQTCPPESNTHRTPWQPHCSAKEKEKEGREDKKHSHAFLSHLSSEADGSTLHTLTEQAAVQLGSCFFHTTAWSWSSKSFRNIPCEEVCIETLW